MEKFRGESSLYTWMNRIAINHCLNDIRKKKQEMLSLDSSAAIKEIKLKEEIEEDQWQVEQIQSRYEVASRWLPSDTFFICF